MTDWQPTDETVLKDQMILVYVDWVNQVRPAILKTGKRGQQPGWYVTFSGSSRFAKAVFP